MRRPALLTLLLAALPLAGVFAPASAAVLPEERADVLYHRYDGGGVTVAGPSILVRKSIGEFVSVSANYYVDMISSASIDVVTTASPYKERREQKSLSADYLHGKSLYSIGYTNSDESDYDANTAFFSVSQDLFGDLTTVTFGFSRGWDTVGKRGDDTFAEKTDRRNYRVGVSQVLTRNLIMGLNFETTTEQGFLRNPYRSMRYVTPDPNVYAFAEEIYPRTRTGNATAARLKYYLPWRASLEGRYRFYTDTWGINAHTAGLEYSQPLWKKWIFTGSYRFYTQNAADFYSDLFPRNGYQNFMARDKEFSSYTSHTLGVGASYEFGVAFAPWIKKGSVNLRYDHMMIDYADFRDLRGFLPGTAAPGSEPLYSLSADVMQLFVSMWF